MERIEAACRVVTPIFLSGADQSRAELGLADKMFVGER